MVFKDAVLGLRKQIFHFVDAFPGDFQKQAARP